MWNGFQLKESAERLLEFCASEAEKDCQHEVRIAQLLMPLKSWHPPSFYGQSSNLEQFQTKRGMKNMDQPNSLMSPNPCHQLNTVVFPLHSDAGQE